MNKLKLFWDWLVWSSANSDKIALTIKGLSSVVAVQFVFNVLLPAAGLHLNLNINDLFDSISSFVYYVLDLVSVVTLLWGAGRKIVNTLIPQ